jgi:hypothetical protein
MLKISVDTDIAQSWLKSRLVQGRALSRTLCGQLNAECAFVYVPCSVSSERLLVFDAGGLAFDADNRSLATSPEGTPVSMTMSVNPDGADIYEFVANYLKDDPTAFCLVEDESADRGDPYLSKRTNLIVHYGKDVHYLLTSRSSREEISEAFMFASGWMRIAFLGRISSQLTTQSIGHEIPELVDIQTVIHGFDYIIADAYDDEGDLICRLFPVHSPVQPSDRKKG